MILNRMVLAKSNITLFSHYLNVCLLSVGSVRNKSACGGTTIQHACALLYSLAAEHKIMAHFKG